MKKVKCELCGKEYSVKGIGTHLWRSHGNGKNHDPNKGYVKGTRKSWNKGLKKENDDRLKEQGKTYSKNLLSGKTKHSFKGKELSESHRNKISKSRIEYLIANPDKVPYLINHSSKMSYPEKIFKQALESAGIKGWVYNYQNSIYQYDFGFPELMIDVEIDGGTHLTEKVKKIDKRRDEFSKSQGWRILRFTATEVKSDLIGCINRLKFLIDGKQ
jgi:very-short-patch-repair endonuclease